MVAIIAGVTLTSCKTKQQVVYVTPPTTQPSTPALMDLPCFEPDDEEWYKATVARISTVNKTNTLATACLRAARQNLQQKIKGAFKQVIRDYFNQMDIDESSTEASHIESAGELIIDQFMNDMMETCRKTTQPDAGGNVIMYMGVKISKKALVDQLVKGLSENQKLKLRFDHDTFRKDAWKNFSQDKQQSFDDYKNSK